LLRVKNCKKANTRNNYSDLFLQMQLQTFTPSDVLKPYIKYYWLCTTDEDVPMEIMYPTGHIELCIDISNGNTVRTFGDRAVTMPYLEVLGHFTMPTRARITKGTTVLVVRFHPYTSSLFFFDQANHFTNDSIDLHAILNKEARALHNSLAEQPLLEQKIQVIEAFLSSLLVRNEKKAKSLQLVECICKDIFRFEESLSIKSLAREYGCSERYLQKLFLAHVGLTPKQFFTVQRFNKSLKLIQSSGYPLTSIAYECGYYDQAHFIKEFKSFTGLVPSQV
jgi:AraC-like DNA-binding protein